jgi:predicted naringenin-chalcone synthase
VFENAGIDQRDLVAPVDWYEREHRWQARNNLYLQASEALFVKVAAKVISAY